MKRGSDIIDGIFKCGVKVDYLFQLKSEVWKCLSDSVVQGTGRRRRARDKVWSTTPSIRILHFSQQALKPTAPLNAEKRHM